MKRLIASIVVSILFCSTTFAVEPVALPMKFDVEQTANHVKWVIRFSERPGFGDVEKLLPALRQEIQSEGMKPTRVSIAMKSEINSAVVEFTIDEGRSRSNKVYLTSLQYVSDMGSSFNFAASFKSEPTPGDAIPASEFVKEVTRIFAIGPAIPRMEVLSSCKGREVSYTVELHGGSWDHVK
jgi:hypothetical protein